MSFEKAEDEYLTPPEDNRNIINYCDICGNDIREGDKYYAGNDYVICEDCLDGIQQKILLKIY